MRTLSEEAFDALPIELQRKFNQSSHSWTPEEAFAQLVPENLWDSPSEVRAWMDGDAFLGIPDRDISRITSGANGGEYTTDNVVMEVASDNRARGAENITPAEMQEIEATNAADAEVIENFFTDDSSLFEGAAAAAESTFLGNIAQGVIDGLIPACGAYYAGTKVADQFDDPLDKVGFGAAAAGGAAAFLLTPPGQICAAAFGAYKLGTYGIKFLGWLGDG